MDQTPEDYKRVAAEHALTLVRDGMRIGIGTGSTARYFIEGMGRLVGQGMSLRGLPTSELSAELARSADVPLLDASDACLDLAVDGADEVDPELRLIKGRGGALLREKLVASAADRFVVIVDETKLVDRLGRGRLPVEIVPFLWHLTAQRIEALGLSWELRGGREKPFVTDNGNLILDVRGEGQITDPEALGARLENQLGVVEHGLFMGLARACIVAGPGGLRVLGGLS
ncbi:MAG TPA: ribose-5-phosphate isomerase RpiA [Candidatus Dormibacteraeota bacterium]|nr:ribose-5-phosphate isomerase RpiA [Candidatus Dormibacteraeota bacterium]